MIDLATAVEASMVALARCGDERAFGELVRRRQVSVRGLLLRLCRDGALADDLAQETFLQAWRRLPGLKADGAFGGWLRQIATNVWLQHVRVRHDALATVEPANESPLRVSEHSTGEALDLDRALSRLAPVERLCIVLAYHEGLSHGEIARTLSMPLGTVKTHIARATQYLRSLLAAYRAP